MELAILVYIVENFTLNSNILFNITIFILAGLAAAHAFKYWYEKDNRPAMEVQQSQPVITGSTIVLRKDVSNLKAGQEYGVLKAYSDGDVMLSGTSPMNGTYYKLHELTNSLVTSPMTLPAVGKSFKIRTKLLVTAATVCLLLHVLLPTKSTAYYMAGAYLLQQVGTSDIAKEVGGLATKAIKSQLQAWSSESPQLEALVKESGVLDDPI